MLADSSVINVGVVASKTMIVFTVSLDGECCMVIRSDISVFNVSSNHVELPA